MIDYDNECHPRNRFPILLSSIRWTLWKKLRNCDKNKRRVTPFSSKCYPLVSQSDWSRPGRWFLILYIHSVTVCYHAQGPGRVFRLRHSVLLRHCGIHWNSCYLFAAWSLFLPELDLQSFWRKNWVLRCLQSRDLWRRLHVSIFNHIHTRRQIDSHSVVGLQAVFLREVTSKSTFRRLRQWRLICWTLLASLKFRTQRTKKFRLELESTQGPVVPVRWALAVTRRANFNSSDL